MSNVRQAPEILWSGQVLAEWTDYNSHLRDAYYLLIFSFAGDALLHWLGLDATGRERSGHSMFTLECHLNYLHELKCGDEVEVRWQLLNADKKRLQLYFSMHRRGSKDAAAVAEQMWLNVDMSGPKSAPFNPAVQLQVSTLAAEHGMRNTPQFVGRCIALPA
ncbi:MAG: thioesterase family protein [Pseudomonas caspiana]